MITYDNGRGYVRWCLIALHHCQLFKVIFDNFALQMKSLLPNSRQKYIVLNHLSWCLKSCYRANLYYAPFLVLISSHGGGRFGLAKTDDVTKMAALTQCCNIRLSTLEKLLEFGLGNSPISFAMRKSLEKDLVAPVLTEDYLKVRGMHLVSHLLACHFVKGYAIIFNGCLSSTGFGSKGEDCIERDQEVFRYKKQQYNSCDR